ncbi:aspartyl protease family protein [uncultured Pontibacter sp.]|uniref:aspartyl protease family protein n=1 Tax=uncultured Pontibacter sp. TaxID=453356 RepID=UPI002624CB01|nr:aspartyl protease family protein [uncultured Pontibacter sp.]
MKTLFLSLALCIAFVLEGTAQTTIQLKEYFKSLKQVDVTIEGQGYSFLFDTGGGETFISPEVAQKIGRQPYGNATAFRMSGEMFRHQKVDSVEMRIGDVPVFHATVGVWDVMGILPEDFPKVDGVISLKSFQDRILTIDLAADRLQIETPATLRKQQGRLTLLPSRFANGLDGSELNIFLGVPHRGHSYWFLFDTGNISEVLLSHQTASGWGLQSDTTVQRTALNPIAIQLGRRKLVSKAAAENIIYDGALNYDVIRQTKITINFPTRQVWMH